MNSSRLPLPPSPRSALDRRRGAPSAPIFGELLAEAGWEPLGPAAQAHEGWVRARGLVRERRAQQERREATPKATAQPS